MNRVERCDVAIVGGGLVGASLALAFAARTALRITVIEAQAPPAAERWHPSFDARSTALSLSSEALFAELGLWTRLAERAEPIRRIHVSDRGRFGSVTLDATEQGRAALGHVAENPWLGRVLYQALQDRATVTLRTRSAVREFRPGPDGWTLRLEHADGDAAVLQVALVVVADGADSTSCRALGIGHEVRDYDRGAVIANVAHGRDHGGMAYERFTDEGPMALLPLPPLDGRSRSALVWVTRSEASEALATLDDDEFRRRLQRRFGYRAGRFETIGSRQRYPLRLTRVRETYRPGLVVLGNAAHTLHPVAGQGFNLSLRDVDALSSCLRDGLAAGASPGDPALLAEYARRQAPDQWQTAAFSDWLPRLFEDRDWVLGLGRDLGLVGLDLVPAWRRRFVDFATGLRP